MSFRRYFLVSALLCTTAGILPATQDVTSMTTTVVTGSPSSSEGYTYNNDQLQVTSFGTATSTYAVTSGADNVFIRRNAVNNNQSSVWYASSGVSTDLAR